MKYFYITLAALLSYLVVYCVACYHVYLRPKTETAVKDRQIFSPKTYCAPAIHFASKAKAGQC